MTYLKVDGENISEYINSATIDREPIWNSDAGRSITGDFIGRIINEKYKINLSTRPLTQEESAFLHNLIRKSSFVTVSFIPPDVDTNTLISRTMYVSPLSNEVYSYNEQLIRYSSMTFNLVEV